MSTEQYRKKIESAIQAIQNENLTTASIQFFTELGYNTTRQSALDKPTYPEFKETYLRDQQFDEVKAKTTEWNYVDFLFQLSKAEITDKVADFGSSPIDFGIESYLFFAIELSKPSYTRSELSIITREVNRLFPMPAMIIFRYGTVVSISIIHRRPSLIDPNKNVLEKVTLIKDINLKNPHRAHIEILNDLSFDEVYRVHKFQSFDDLHNAWQKVLNTKELNKKFFEDLFKWYLWAKAEVKFPNSEGVNDDVYQSESLIRFISRILFVWFMKEKGLIQDDLFKEDKLKEILKDFNPANSNKTTYYRTILQNLFFATLNMPIGKREWIASKRKNKDDNGNPLKYRYEDEFIDSKSTIETLLNTIPFLNGGLFDCLDIRFKDKEVKNGAKEIFKDGFTKDWNKKNVKLHFPDKFFFGEYDNIDLSSNFEKNTWSNVKISGIIDILNNYKFTIEENTPLEVDIALDPELLGKVFENLLASYNPDAKVNARNLTGSFYTPREIVNYMVDESLKQYLKSKMLAESTENNPFGKAQGELFGNETRKQTQLIISHKQSRWIGKEETLEAKLNTLFDDHTTANPFDEIDTLDIIGHIDDCKILDPACGSGAFPMGILLKLVQVLNILDPENQLWLNSVIAKLPSAMQESTRRKLKNENFNYVRKLGLIQNCIYGIDIQPIAIQISKLRFFISLLVDQKKNDNKDENYGLLPLPNMDFKLVTANTLIGMPKSTFHENDLFVKDEFREEFGRLTSQYFDVSAPNEKKSIKSEIETLINTKVNIKCAEIENELGRFAINGVVNDRKRLGEIERLESEKNLWLSYPNIFRGEKVDFFDIPYFFPKVKEGFDVVIGNPPYGASLSNLEIQTIKSNYINQTTETAILFIEKGYNLLKESGAESYIIPKAFTFASNYDKIRNSVLNELVYLVDCGKAFEQVKLEACVFGLFKNSNSVIYKSYRLENDNSIELKSKIEKKLSLKFGFLPNGLNDLEIELGNKIKNQSVTLNSISNNSRGEILQNKIVNSGKYPIIGGKEIDKYGIRGTKGFINDKSLISEKSKIRKNSLIVQNIVAHLTKPYDHLKIIACIPNIECFIVDSINQIIIFDNSYSNRFAWCILNTKLTNWFCYLFILGKAIRTIHFDNPITSRIPIKLPTDQTPFITLVDQILADKKAGLDTTALEHQIDVMVYHLYELSYEEACVIDKELSREDWERYKL